MRANSTLPVLPEVIVLDLLVMLDSHLDDEDD